MKIFAIYDTKAETYHQPFFSPTVATALRSCEQAANDPDSTFHNHSEDYLLFSIGEWDEKTAQLTQNDKDIQSIVKFHELVNSPAIAPLLQEA